MPALAKTKSTRPCAAIVDLKSAASEDHDDTSVDTKVKDPGAGGGLMSAETTFAPREARRETVARPMPEEPPDIYFSLVL